MTTRTRIATYDDLAGYSGQISGAIQNNSGLQGWKATSGDAASSSATGFTLVSGTLYLCKVPNPRSTIAEIGALLSATITGQTYGSFSLWERNPGDTALIRTLTCPWTGNLVIGTDGSATNATPVTPNSTWNHMYLGLIVVGQSAGAVRVLGGTPGYLGWGYNSTSRGERMHAIASAATGASDLPTSITYASLPRTTINGPIVMGAR